MSDTEEKEADEGLHSAWANALNERKLGFESFVEASLQRQKNFHDANTPTYMPDGLWKNGCIDFACDMKTEQDAHQENSLGRPDPKVDDGKCDTFRAVVQSNPNDPLWLSLRPLKWFPQLEVRIGMDQKQFDDLYRLDACGNVLYRLAPANSPLGWQPDHFWPHSKGGLTERCNLHLLHRAVNTPMKMERPWSSVREIGCVGVTEKQWLFTLCYRNWNNLQSETFHDVFNLGPSETENLERFWTEINDSTFTGKTGQTIHPLLFLYRCARGHQAIAAEAELRQSLKEFSESKKPDRLKNLAEKLGDSRWGDLREVLALKGLRLSERLAKEVEKEQKSFPNLSKLRAQYRLDFAALEEEKDDFIKQGYSQRKVDRGEVVTKKGRTLAKLKSAMINLEKDLKRTDKTHERHQELDEMVAKSSK